MIDKNIIELKREFLIPRKFEPLFKDELPYRVICYYGGRGGGKTWSIARFLAMKATQQVINIAVSRKIKGDNKFSLHETFIKVFGLIGVSLVRKGEERLTLENGSNIFLLGASETTKDSVRGIENVAYFWLEEAHNISDGVIKDLIPSVRGLDGKGAKIIISINPQSKNDYIYKTFINAPENDYSIAIKVNYTDNPFFTEDLNRDRLHNKATLPLEEYLHLWEGETNDYNDLKVINTELIGYFDNNQTFDYRYLVISIDTATSVKSGADYSAIGVFGLLDSKEVHLVHMNRGHYDFHTLLSEIKNTYEITKELTKRTPNLILLESKANGLSVMQELQRTTNLRVKGINPMSDKLSRVVNDFLPFIDKLKLPMHQNIYNFWINDYLSECKSFRADNKHEHDDMIDSTSQALAFLCRKTFNYDNIKEAFSGLKN